MKKYFLFDSPIDQFEVLYLIGENFEFIVVLSALVFWGFTSLNSADKGSDLVNDLTLNDYLQEWGLNSNNILIKNPNIGQFQNPVNTDTSVHIMLNSPTPPINNNIVLYNTNDLINLPPFLNNMVNQYYLDNNSILDILNNYQTPDIDDNVMYAHALTNNTSIANLAANLDLNMQNIYIEARSLLESVLVNLDANLLDPLNIQTVLTQIINMGFADFNNTLSSLIFPIIFGGIVFTVDHVIENYYLDFESEADFLSLDHLDIFRIVEMNASSIFSLLTAPLVVVAAYHIVAGTILPTNPGND